MFFWYIESVSVLFYLFDVFMFLNKTWFMIFLHHSRYLLYSGTHGQSTYYGGSFLPVSVHIVPH